MERISDPTAPRPPPRGLPSSADAHPKSWRGVHEDCRVPRDLKTLGAFRDDCSVERLRCEDQSEESLEEEPRSCPAGAGVKSGGF